MAELRTRIVLRNDSTANWLAHEGEVLLKGEVGFEFLADGQVKMKIGDGFKAWYELPYFADGDASALEVAVRELAAKHAEEISALQGKDVEIEEAVSAITTTISELAATHESEVAALQAKDTEIEGNVTALSNLIGDIADGKTVVELIAEAQEAATYDDAALVARVAANEDAITILNGDVNVVGSVDKKVADKVAAEINAFAEEISEDGFVNTFKELVDYVAEHGSDTAEMAAAIAKKVDKEDGKSLVADGLIAKLGGIAAGAQVNVINSVDEEQFAIDENKKLTLLDIAMGKVTGLEEALDNKVDKVAGARLIREDEASKLEKLVVADDGSIEISGEINASNVKELDSWITNNRDNVLGLFDAEDDSKLDSIAPGAQVNVLEAVQVGGTLLDIVNKTVNIPVATADAFGVVKSAEGENKVMVAEDGTMEVGSVNVNRLVQTEDEVLILNGGAAC
jgi:hypothetical protein